LACAIMAVLRQAVFAPQLAASRLIDPTRNWPALDNAIQPTCRAARFSLSATDCNHNEGPNLCPKETPGP
jgi:hypothetical protein